ncbi:hypothetical protein BH11GEM1_BH11GEM1_27730 [soil metagenome]
MPGLLALASAIAVGAQEPQDTTVIRVTPAFDGLAFVASDSSIEIGLSRWPEPNEGRLAVLVGTTDLTPLFARRGANLRFTPSGIPLPAGESEVKAFLVNGEDWKELGRFPLKVLTPRGFEKASFDPALEVNNAGQIDERHSGTATAPPRSRWQDVNATTGFQMEQLKNGTSVRSQLHLMATGQQSDALRYAEKGDAASRVDLADYQLVIERERRTVSVGNVSAGNNRLLINSFASRGIVLAGASDHATLSLGAQSGTSIVGWDNITGVARDGHRVVSGSLGYELRPSEPGLLHLDATALHGSLLPVSGYTQGGTVESERSAGFGVQLAAAIPNRRVRVAGGLASSRFESPPDPNNPPPPSSPEPRRGARYAEVEVAFLKEARIGGVVPVTLTGTARDERVDPLYRSVAAYMQADAARRSFELGGTVDVVAVQVTHGRTSDNLDDITSVMKNLTRSTAISLSAPMAGLFRVTNNAAWLPAVTLSRQRVHPYGAGIPANSAFTASDVPDEMDVVHDVSAQWQTTRWQLAYRFNQSTQDNRQPGRELADFRASTHGVTVSFAPSPALDVGVTLNRDVHANLELAQLSRLQRVGFTGAWRATSLLKVDGAMTVSRNADFGAAANTHLSELNIGAAHGIKFRRSSDAPPSGQVFVRYSKRADDVYSLALVPLATLSGDMWNVTSGLSLRLF